ncbi:MAG TPA: dihydrofolate reductase [Kofleriaceae bacterium]|nr:dihydrofolate reductase [Kofleriaceae bacterium]
MSFDVVVAADLDWGIGKDQTLPWPKLRGDLRHFKRITSTTSTPGRKNAIVMGRKTWQSKEVGERALPDRVNVVVSRSDLAVPPGVIAARSLDEALAVRDVETVFVVGGAILLIEAIERRDLRYVYLTRVEERYDCEVRMPDLDARGFVKVAWEGELTNEEHGVRYRIERLRR